jgi:hypothetical protein
MNRNYLPPSVLNAGQVAGSPPSNSYVISQQRRYGRACKLPTVQEVMGKSSSFVEEIKRCGKSTRSEGARGLTNKQIFIIIFLFYYVCVCVFVLMM